MRALTRAFALPMAEPVVITEVLGRAEQGVTRPFICRGGMFETYYVKGAYAGLRSLCCEWVAHRLASLILPKEWPLAVPHFCIAEVPSPLIEASARQDIRELGSGPAFGSGRIHDAQELDWTAAQGWPPKTMALLLLLDLWLQNEDRSLSIHGGNPNLFVRGVPPLPDDDPEGALWAGQPPRQMLWAYDFNLAFDEDFNRARFFESHVFGQQLQQWPDGFRAEMEPVLREAMESLDSIFSELPEEWLHLDGDDSLPVQLCADRLRFELGLPFTQPESFWKIP